MIFLSPYFPVGHGLRQENGDRKISSPIIEWFREIVVRVIAVVGSQESPGHKVGEALAERVAEVGYSFTPSAFLKASTMRPSE